MDRVLVTVKTYPHPSKSYDELVCTAGVREDGSFVRIYPLNFRDQPFENQYRKYQWIELDLLRNEDDPRPESFRPGGSIRTIGEPLSTERGWLERRKFVLARPPRTMCELNQTPQTECSLGIIKPREVQAFIDSPDDREWKPKWRVLFEQQNLFGHNMRPLEKIPYKFRYKFLCENPKCKGHKMVITDWEVGQLFRRMREGFNERTAIEKVREKFLDVMCHEKKDTYFYVGTALRFQTWIILGVFWPPNKVAHEGPRPTASPGT